MPGEAPSRTKCPKCGGKVLADMRFSGGGRRRMAEILNELQLIKEAAEEAIGAAEDPLVADWLQGVATTAGGYIDQLTPRAAGTDVKFAEAPKPQPPIESAPAQEEAEGTPDAPAANQDTGGAEDEPEPDPTPTSEHHATSHRRRQST